MASQAGYTLLEVMLALVILAAASTLVVVNMPPPEPTLAREARVLAARLVAAADEAVVSGTPVGVDVDETGYRFRRRIARDWVAIDDPTLAARAWPAGTAVEIVRDGAAFDRSRLEDLDLDPFKGPGLGGGRGAGQPPPPPVMRFDAVGAATEIMLDLRDARGVYRITVAADGAVSLAAPEGR